MGVKVRVPRERARQPWEVPPSIDDADIFAIQALARGIANEGQQRRAYEFIVDGLCETDRISFTPGGDHGARVTAFAEGKRWIGLQLRRIRRMVPDLVTENRPEPEPPDEWAPEKEGAL